jgi:hypothetical protein
MRHDPRLPWTRETVGHSGLAPIVDKLDRSLAVPLPDGTPPSTDATWIISADNLIVAFVGNGPHQTDNADLIIRSVAELPVYREALQTAIATVCRCNPPHPGPAVHKDGCPVWMHGFAAARELLGIERP